MRVHQSWYRKSVLEVDPGPNPNARGELYGNMLSEDDGEAGRNFLGADAWDVAKAWAGRSKASHLKRNMLSSQPMCFNLLGPLATNPQLATTFVRCLPGAPKDLHVTGIFFEWAPDPATHLDDRTAHDALVIYRRPGGKRGFIAVETKLTEPFSTKRCKFKAAYRRWITLDGSWWRPGLEVHFSEKAYNQLWRNQLLAFAMLHQDGPEYDEGFNAVVYPAGDASCADALTAYREHLTHPAQTSLVAWPLHEVVDRWLASRPPARYLKWLRAFRLRYLDLEPSRTTWDLHLESNACRVRGGHQEAATSGRHH